MENKQIKPKKIYEEVQEIILKRVESGELEPGDRLESVEKLSQQYGVSRSAVREALSGLRAMGLVEMYQGEGTFITSFSASTFSLPVATALIMKKNDIIELMAVRRILEIGMVSVAAKEHMPEDIQHLEKTLQMMKETEGKGEYGEQADLEFHLEIAKATHNKVLINLVSSVSDITLEAMRETRRVILYSEEGMATLYEEHARILEAIKNRDVKQAEKEMYNHLMKVEVLLEEYLD